MLSNYGYEDASGIYYIQIDTDKCRTCTEKACVKVCPAGLFEIYTDDEDEEATGIKGEMTHQLRLKCNACKNDDNMGKHGPLLRCVTACHARAIKHSW